MARDKQRVTLPLACVALVALAAGAASAVTATTGSASPAGAAHAPPAPEAPGSALGATGGGGVDDDRASGAAVATGSIEGVVTRTERPQRRVVNRYPAGGEGGGNALQAIPVVAYLEGSVAGSPAASPRPVQVTQKDTAFAPAVLVVPVGTNVSYANQDPFFHNVFSFSPAKRFDLGRYPAGEAKSVVFDQPGAVKVYCEVHDYMRSAVIVVENPHHVVVGSDGRFTLANVPAGTHRLVVWDVELNPKEVQVTVPENGVVRVQVTLD